MNQRYNQPDITDTEFLRAVMHDPKVAIEDRVRAAIALLEIEPHGPPRPSLTIQINATQEMIDKVHEWEQWQSFCVEQWEYYQSLSPAEQAGLNRGCQWSCAM